MRAEVDTGKNSLRAGGARLYDKYLSERSIFQNLRDNRHALLSIRNFAEPSRPGNDNVRVRASIIVIVTLTSLLLCNSITQAALVVRDIHSTGTVNSLADVDALISGVGIQSEATNLADVIDYLDVEGNGGTGHFMNNFAFPNDQVGVDDNDFGIHITGSVFIPTAGDWTFGINSDDGSRVRINGSDVIVDDTLHAPQDRFGVINLAGGFHDIDVIFFERGGGAELELFAAQGSFNSFSGNGFQLVGDTANGGLATSTSAAGVPEPSGLLVIGAWAIGTCLSRRRKTRA